MLELGLIGSVFSLLMRIATVVWSVLLATRARTRPIKAVAVVGFPFMAVALWVGNGVFAASYMALAYWFFVGLLAIGQRDHRRMDKDLNNGLGRVIRGAIR